MIINSIQTEYRYDRKFLAYTQNSTVLYFHYSQKNVFSHVIDLSITQEPSTGNNN